MSARLIIALSLQGTFTHTPAQLEAPGGKIYVDPGADITFVGLEAPGAPSVEIVNRGTDNVTFLAASTEVATADRFTNEFVLPGQSSVLAMKNADGLGWNLTISGGAGAITKAISDAAEGTPATGDMVLFQKAAVARVVIGTVAAPLVAEDVVTLGGLSGIVEDDIVDGTTAEIVAWAEAGKASIPAASVVDNLDDTFTITFAAGNEANTVETTSSNGDLTFAEDTAGSDPTIKKIEWDDFVTLVNV